MNTEITVNKTTQGWVYYDAGCAFCVATITRLSSLLGRHGFRLLPLQTPGAAARISVSGEALLARMHLLMVDGRRYAGADALVEIAQGISWARLLVAATRLPAILPLLRRGYDWIAAHRTCDHGTCVVQRKSNRPHNSITVWKGGNL
ncbi:MAG: DUF393 domain-containing protein [Verrucomicrobia bacterium]|nr:DUF393 domain-containing protein [Verrucomicrobiota bacterium]